MQAKRPVPLDVLVRRIFFLFSHCGLRAYRGVISDTRRSRGEKVRRQEKENETRKKKQDVKRLVEETQAHVLVGLLFLCK